MPELAIAGGAPVRSEPYPEWPHGDDEDVAAVEEVVRSGRWGGFPEPGPKAAAFEQAFASYQGARYGVLMANGTVTMEVALKALGIGWGDEVIIPALTFAATVYAPIAAGCGTCWAAGYSAPSGTCPRDHTTRYIIAAKKKTVAAIMA